MSYDSSAMQAMFPVYLTRLAETHGENLSPPEIERKHKELSDIEEHINEIKEGSTADGTPR